MLFIDFFIIIFLKPINSLLTLNFKRNITKDLSPDNLMINLFKNDIYTNFDIGTPNQEIPISIKLQTYAFYIVSSESKISLKTFSSNDSKTFYSTNNVIRNLMNEDFNFAFFSSDIINFSNINKKNNFSFFLVKNTSNTEICEGGGIGLNIKPKSPNIEKINFINELKEQNLISSYAFSIKYKNEKEGELIIGKKPHEYDNERYKNEYFHFANIPIYSYDFQWGLYFDKVQYGNIDLNKRINQVLIFEIELGVIISNSEYKNFIQKNFFEKYINEKKCFIGTFGKEGYKYFYCNENVDITLMQNLSFYNQDLNYTFELNYKDLFYNFDGKNYYLVVFPWYLGVQWRMGLPFFKKYQLIFDSEKKIIGVYERILEKKSNIFKFWKNNLIIFLIFVIAFLIFYIIRNIKNKSRKIRANELNENYDYLPEVLEYKLY